MSKFTIDVTDTFGGEANYSWVRRFTFHASSFRGAVGMLAREYATGWRKDYDAGDTARYNLTCACICAFITAEY